MPEASAATRAPPDAPSARERVAIAGLIVAIGLVLWTTRALGLFFDGMSYVLAAAEGQHLFHPHHLLHTFALFATHRGLDAIAGPFDVQAAAQLHNVAWALVLLAAFWSLARALAIAPLPAAAATLLVAASFGLLRFATQPESFVPATACVLVLFRSVVSRAPAAHLAGAAALAGAVLYHQSNVLVCIALFPLLAAKARRFVAVVGLAGAACLAAYVATYLGTAREPPSPRGFADFCLRYAVMDRSWGTAANLTVAGIANVGGSVAWNLAGTTAPLAAGLLVEGAVLALLAAAVLPLRRREPLHACLALHVLVTQAFFLWWLPGEAKYLFPVMPSLVLLAVARFAHGPGAAAKAAKAAAAIVAGVALVLGAWNLTRSVLPLHRDVTDAEQRAVDLVEHAGGDGLLVCDRLTAMYALHHDRGSVPTTVIEIELALLALEVQAAGGAAGGDASDPAATAARVVVPMDVLRPPYAKAARDVHVAAWRELLRRLAGLSAADADGTRRTFRVVRAGATPVLEIRPERVPGGGLPEFLAALDAAAADAGLASAFAEWGS